MTTFISCYILLVCKTLYAYYMWNRCIFKQVNKLKFEVRQGKTLSFSRYFFTLLTEQKSWLPIHDFSQTWAIRLGHCSYWLPKWMLGVVSKCCMYWFLNLSILFTQYAVESQVKFHGFDPAVSVVEVPPREASEYLRVWIFT